MKHEPTTCFSVKNLATGRTVYFRTTETAHKFAEISTNIRMWLGAPGSVFKIAPSPTPNEAIVYDYVDDHYEGQFKDTAGNSIWFDRGPVNAN